MPTIEMEGRRIECAEGDNLRRVLMQEDATLYNGCAAWIHCRGLGTCGTCAVEVEGSISPMTRVEKWRLSFPPHRPEAGLRLACQTWVLGDLRIVKHSGLWGSKIDEKSQTAKKPRR